MTDAVTVENTGGLKASILQQLGTHIKGSFSLQLLLLLALARLYTPLISTVMRVLSRVFPSLMKDLACEEDNQELNAPIKKIYESFVDDRVADVKVEDVKILSDKGYDKFKYVSDDFIEIR